MMIDPKYVIFPGFSNLSQISIDVLDTPPAILTFSSAFSTLFSVDPNNGSITLIGNLNYNSLAGSGFTESLLLRVQDNSGGVAVALVTIPVLDSNLSPKWSGLPTQAGVYSVTILEMSADHTLVQQLAPYVGDPNSLYSVNASWYALTIFILPGSGCDGSSCPFEIFNNTLRVKTGGSVLLNYLGNPNSWSFLLREFNI